VGVVFGLLGFTLRRGDVAARNQGNHLVAAGAILMVLSVHRRAATSSPQASRASGIGLRQRLKVMRSGTVCRQVYSNETSLPTMSGLLI
jgi:hypothetical protein